MDIGRTPVEIQILLPSTSPASILWPKPWKGWLGVRRINIPFSDVTCQVGLDVTRQTWTSWTTAAHRTSTFAYNHKAQIVRSLHLSIYKDNDLRRVHLHWDPLHILNPTSLLLYWYYDTLNKKRKHFKGLDRKGIFN